jgi:hypothetical protein
MKKPASTRRSAPRYDALPGDEIRPEYDFSKARRNPYAGRFGNGVTVVTLDADVAMTFPDADSVNDALRAPAKNANRPPKESSSRRRTA